MVVGQTYSATHFQYRIIEPLMLPILLWRSIDAVECEILPGYLTLSKISGSALFPSFEPLAA
jgi:hypothetical protein